MRPPSFDWGPHDTAAPAAASARNGRRPHAGFAVHSAAQTAKPPSALLRGRGYFPDGVLVVEQAFEGPRTLLLQSFDDLALHSVAVHRPFHRPEDADGRGRGRPRRHP